MSNGRVVYNVLFLGNGNSARSIMAEAILNQVAGRQFRGYSAGIQAHTEFDPRAVALLDKMHLAQAGAYPKNWDELAGPDAPEFDFVFTMCESATLLPRSMWKGNCVISHWRIPNPALVDGNEAQRRLAYADTFRMIQNRIQAFTSLPADGLRALMAQNVLGNVDVGKSGTAVAA